MPEQIRDNVETLSEIFREIIPNCWASYTKRTYAAGGQFQWRHHELIASGGSESIP